MILEELQIYRSASIAMVKPDDTTFKVDLSVENIDGDKTGHVQIGYNQAFYIGSGQLPNHLSVYRGGEVTLQGELRVAGVDVMIEGNMRNVENLTVVEGGTHYYLIRIIYSSWCVQRFYSIVMWINCALIKKKCYPLAKQNLGDDTIFC